MVSEATKRQIGQHFVLGFEGFEPSENIKKLISEYYVGSVIVFRRNIQNIAQLHKLIQDLQQIARDSGHAQPLLIGIDQENGLVSAFSSSSQSTAGTQFPGAMAIGATKDPNLAREVAKSTGRELRLAGINWVYSPVADINSDPRNPVIGVRSFGEDADEVSKFVCAASNGSIAAGIASTAKHFPGHGDTHTDSHLALPVITKDLTVELVPFQAAIENGIPSIMTGHMAVPLLSASLDADEAKNLPASLSKAVTTTLLREKLSFKGVIVTDCLEMNAISEGYGTGPGAVLALRAGADIAMICHRIDRQLAALEATYTAVEKGDLGTEYLSSSGERIRAMKDKFAGHWEDVLGKSLDSDELSIIQKKNEQFSREVYALSTRWLSRPEGNKDLYISPHADVLVLIPQLQSINLAVDDSQDLLRTSEGRLRNTAGPSYVAFAAAISRRAPFSTFLVYTPEDGEGRMLSETLEKSILSAHAVVFTTRNAHQAPWQIEVLKQVVDAINRTVEGRKDKPVKLIVVSSCAPYDHAVMQSDAKLKSLPCLCTYEFTKPALEEAAAKLYGESLVRLQK